MAKGRSGSYRQTTRTLAELRSDERHERRADLTGWDRSVEDRAPLVWSQGEVAEAEAVEAPDGIQPEDRRKLGRWKSSLVVDYERHTKNARRDKRATKDATHAFLQFPTSIEVTPEVERQMLLGAVEFVNALNGGDAVFHARLDRDEMGKHGVDVFLAPKFLKATGKGRREKTKTWISLSKFAKAEAKRRGLSDGAIDRGRMFQDAWLEHLQAMGWTWAVRGESKETPFADRLSPDQYKLKQDQTRLAHEAWEVETTEGFRASFFRSEMAEISDRKETVSDWAGSVSRRERDISAREKHLDQKVLQADLTMVNARALGQQVDEREQLVSKREGEVSTLEKHVGEREKAVTQREARLPEVEAGRSKQFDHALDFALGLFVQGHLSKETGSWAYGGNSPGHQIAAWDKVIEPFRKAIFTVLDAIMRRFADMGLAQSPTMQRIRVQQARSKTVSRRDTGLD